MNDEQVTKLSRYITDELLFDRESWLTLYPHVDVDWKAMSLLVKRAINLYQTDQQD